MNDMKQAPLPAFTPADIDALPTGPMRTVREPHPDQSKAAWLYRAEYPPVVARHHAPGEPVWYHDSHGEKWRVGQWGDGTWYKQRWMW
jgi:hypothetical protein